MRMHGRASISRSNPRAQGVCDRCGFRYSHHQLKWQFDWAGARLQNKYILVCSGCLDVPQENIRTIVLPPDPMPITNPRPEQFVSDNNPISGIGWDPVNFFNGKAGTPATSAFFGTMQGGGGPDATFRSLPGSGSIATLAEAQGVKVFVQSASLTPSSTAAAGNSVGINWSQIPGAPPPPVTLPAVPAQGFVITGATMSAPIDAAFLGSNLPTTLELDGSNDGVTWTQLGTVATLGTKGEVARISTTNTTNFGFHRILVAGDGAHAAAIASISLKAAGPSIAQTGSELGA
jgi:hypothetical protein